ncbi:YbjN domain-containing protein [Dactylosporangium sp. AC04546]|uniref:YbjN domain-containing protein n=1 Tax=Dactylosporangium sp. AC04546 TaxID=2862460 RepID=UPI001EDD34BF|nr:YbjN domain-containing protein [Dactylosporangium sp. AC04546]WVK83614.1 YbjN domain-containing protein [Dactylosporangium sp. AC04546]
MSIDDALRAKVRGLVTDYLGGQPVPDDLTAAPAAIRSGTAVLYLRLINNDPPLVRVFSPLLRKIECSPELLTELNELNGRLNFIRLFWRDQSVIASTELLAATLDPIELTNACDWLADAADYYDVRLHAQFGGELAFAPPPASAHPADAP